MRRLEVVPIEGLPEVRAGDDLAGLILEACGAVYPLRPDDVVVVSQKMVSKAEGRLVRVDPDDPLSHKPLVISEAHSVCYDDGAT